APAPAPAASSGGGTVWDDLAQCESGGNWSINTGNGYYGGLQFSQSSWNAAGGSGNPANASRAEQIRVAENLLDMQGWGAWPSCSSQLGLR
ncbi:MAG: transglycosylase family protein, partial [Acidimicrobiales bacterium]|nr:transglycosylase family protein [Acidimicrobiales bacterium]